jgi:hypothetical protein
VKRNQHGREAWPLDHLARQDVVALQSWLVAGGIVAVDRTKRKALAMWPMQTKARPGQLRQARRPLSRESRSPS